MGPKASGVKPALEHPKHAIPIIRAKTMEYRAFMKNLPLKRLPDMPRTSCGKKSETENALGALLGNLLLSAPDYRAVMVDVHNKDVGNFVYVVVGVPVLHDFAA